MRLNRFIAASGVCTRREADVLIAEGRVKVNDNPITKLGSKIDPRRDKVELDGERLTGSTPVFLLMNKGPGIPSHKAKGKNIYSLIGEVAEGCSVLDPLPHDWRGLVVLTNDLAVGERKSLQCIYLLRFERGTALKAHIHCMALLSKEEVVKEVGDPREDGSFGITLSKSSPGVLKSLLGDFVKRLEYVDRVGYGPLTKRDLPRGRWRILEDTEYAAFKMRR